MIKYYTTSHIPFKTRKAAIADMRRFMVSQLQAGHTNLCFKVTCFNTDTGEWLVSKKLTDKDFPDVKPLTAIVV